VAMTADIPPGPARVAGTGIVMLAKTTGRPIVPLAVATTHAYVFGNWSKFAVNLPFGTLAAVYGQSIWVATDADDAAIEIARKQVEAELDRVTARAYELAGGRDSVSSRVR
jgi:3-deoxy-D-manno-octulosonic-acid transferase